MASSDILLAPPSPPGRRDVPARPAGPPPAPRLAGVAAADFARAQAVNAARSLASLRPFRSDEFGEDAAAPSPAHLEAANRLIQALRRRLRRRTRILEAESASPGGRGERGFEALLHHKHDAQGRIKDVEKVWDYYWELFSQRQTPFGRLLKGMDRIALDCYQAVFTGLGAPRQVPSPPPFTYMETGFTPSTYRRRITFSKLGKRSNPFPIVQLPYHRIVNPWTLGAAHHEVSHNLQSDLDLWTVVPRRIAGALLRDGISPPVAAVWSRWHKEMWADLCAALLGGPAMVDSLMDVVSRTPRATLHFNPSGVHPTPFLRTLINTRLVRRMGFGPEADRIERLWRRLYPDPGAGTLPAAMLRTFPRACDIAVDEICFQPYPQLGNRSLFAVTHFDRNHLRMTEEAAARLAKGIDPGIVPARFLVGAARVALNRRHAPPGRIAANFYRALDQR